MDLRIRSVGVSMTYNSTKYGPNKTPNNEQPIDYQREYKVPLHGDGVHAMYGGTDDTQPYPNGSGGLLPSGEANFFDTSQSHSYDERVWTEGTGPSGINAYYPSGDFEHLRTYFEDKFGSVPSDPTEFTEWVLLQSDSNGIGTKSGVYLTYPESKWELSHAVKQSGILHYDKTFFEAGSGINGWEDIYGNRLNRDRLSQSQYSNAERTLEVEIAKGKIRQIRDYVPVQRDTLIQDIFTPYIHYIPFEPLNAAVYIKFLADYKYSTNNSSPYR